VQAIHSETPSRLRRAGYDAGAGGGGRDCAQDTFGRSQKCPSLSAYSARRQSTTRVPPAPARTGVPQQYSLDTSRLDFLPYFCYAEEVKPVHTALIFSLC